MATSSRNKGTNRRSHRQSPVATDLVDYLTCAQSCLSDGREDQILAELEPVKALLPLATGAEKDAYERLLALGCAFQNRLLDAEAICLEGLADHPNSLDFRFVLTYVYLSLREFDKAAAAGNEYVAQFARRGDDLDSSGQFTASRRHLSNVHNFIGSAFFEQERWPEARRAFEASVSEDAGNYLPYLNLARASRRAGNFRAAEAVIARGIKACRQVSELRLMAQSLKKKATISACMIVKNEETLLPGCLDSIRDWVDEIVLVDTGSSDTTVAIGQSYGARVFHQTWEGDFSKHRNYSIEQATGDWIFIIDADERFDRKDIPAVLDIVNDERHQAISINVYNLYGSVDHKLTAINSIRFFRRSLGLRYEGIVHNSLRVKPGVAITRAPFALEHLGYDLSPERMKAKFERSHELLLKQVRENPDYAYAWFNLAQLYRGRLAENPAEFGPKVIECAQKVIALIGPDDRDRRHFYVMAHDQIAWVHFVLGDYDEAAHWMEKALVLKPDYLDPLMLRAHLFARRHQFEPALQAYQDYLRAQAAYDENRETAAYILYHPDSKATAYFGMGCIAELLGRLDEAEKYYETTLRHNPHYLQANLHLGRLYLQQGNLSAAQRCFERQLDSRQPTAEAALGLAQVAVRQGEPEQAEQHLQRALEMAPESPEVLAHIGRYYQERGEAENAAAVYSRWLALQPGNADAAAALAAMRFEMKQYSEAASLYVRALESAPQRAEWYNDLGNCYFRRGEFETACGNYQKCVDLDGPAIAWRNLGLARLKLGQNAPAAEALRNCLKQSPDQTELLPLLADVHLQLGDYAEAVEYYERVLTASPRSVSALFGLSECYLLMGHRDSAILGYRRAVTIDPTFSPALARLEELQPAMASS